MDLLTDQVESYKQKEYDDQYLKEYQEKVKRVSLIGHLEIQQAPSLNISLRMSSPFLMTMQFLETKDIFKMLCISKTVRAGFCANHEVFRQFLGIFATNIKELSEEV